MTTAEILAKAADLIEPEGAWTQHDWAKDSTGKRCAPIDKDAVCWCAEGAIRHVVWLHPDLEPGAVTYADAALIKAIRGQMIFRWNDFGRRRQATVVQALRDAAKATS